MSDASVTVSARSTGADLRAIARELARMDDARVKRLFKDRLEAAARPVVPRVRASVLAIPAAGEKHTGLRARIAACAEVRSFEPGPRQVSTAVEINPHHMPPGQRALPAYMEGAKPRWRHPVYGRRDNPSDWAAQSAHPFFYQAARQKKG